MLERINKVLAHAGIGSRRHCDTLLEAGRVTINGETVRDLGMRVDPGKQTVCVDQQPIKLERHVYWVVNKPQGVLCTNYDPAGRPRAIDLVPHIPQRVYTVGRLDEDSEGLLILTNDGELAFRLMHPKFGIEKTYHAQVAGKPTQEQIQKMLEGMYLSDGRVKAQRVRRMYTQGESTWLEIVLSEGKNREIRRMLAKLDHKVIRLRRVSIGPIFLGHLGKGKSHPIRGRELFELRRSVGLSQEERDQAEPAVAVTVPPEPRPQRTAKPERREKRMRSPLTGQKPHHRRKPTQ